MPLIRVAATSMRSGPKGPCGRHGAPVAGRRSREPPTKLSAKGGFACTASPPLRWIQPAYVDAVPRKASRAAANRIPFAAA